MMSGAKKRKSEESLVCWSSNAAPVIEYRDVYVHFSGFHLSSFVSTKDDSDGGIYRLPSPALLGGGPPTRIHYDNSYSVLKFTEEFKRTIVQVYVNLYMQQGAERETVQLKGLWQLLGTFTEIDTVKKVIVRLADPEEAAMVVGMKIGEKEIYDDSLFFDVAKVTMLCRAFENVELHTKCNVIQAEHINQLVQFFNTFNHYRRLVIYISEFMLYLNSICVTQTDGKFKSLNASVKVTQFGKLVTVKIGILTIQFEDEFRALEFRNYE